MEECKSRPLNIASPDVLSALQNWHDGVIWASAPPLIASDVGMVDRGSQAQTGGGLVKRSWRKVEADEAAEMIKPDA